MKTKNEVAADVNEDLNTELSPETEAGAETTATKRPRKLTKDVSDPACVKITVIGGTQGTMSFNLSELPEAIMTVLPGFGLGHKLGDAAAGESGVEAETAIQTVWEALKKGEFTVRQPAEPKVTLSSIREKLANLSPEARAAAEAQLALLGVSL